MHPKSTKLTRLCATCGKEFSYYPSTQPRAQYCSVACRAHRLPIPEQFWRHVTKTDDGCWLWQGTPNRAGYGSVIYGKRRMSAHRLAYVLTYGPVSPELDICHHCDVLYPRGDTTYRRCCRPDHLFAGTRKENMADARAKGRVHIQPRKPRPPRRPKGNPGERNSQATLTAAQVLEIRARCAAGEDCHALAREFGTIRFHIWQIVTRRRWKHLP